MENIISYENTIRSLIRTVPDFPKPGVLFYDITTLLKTSQGLKAALEAMAYQTLDLNFSKIAAIEARGFIFASSLAQMLGKGLVLIRKKGKLPGTTHSIQYGLEYGSDTLEISDLAVDKGDELLIIDDVLATGGTAKASCELIEKIGGQVSACLFLMELSNLKGESMIAPRKVKSVIKL